jgi:4-diphosphocytidyl-2-C-methyl-D-erythritol kinase
VRLRALAPGKVNLCLFLGGLRADGRHELVTLFESVSLADELVLSTVGGGGGEGLGAGPGPGPGPGPGGGPDEVVCPGVEGPNLVSLALQALRADGWAGPPVRIEIRKHVPVAAGMGGGSADAAAALRLAQQLGRINDGQLAELASELGADVPSQLAPGLVLGTGAGDVVERQPPLAPHALVILPLPFELSTPEVYGEADRLGLARTAGELASRYEQLAATLAPGTALPVELLVNDLEPAARSLCPAIDKALQALRDVGAAAAFVCGSGPTSAGVYWGPDAPERAAAAATVLAARFPNAIAVSPVLAAAVEIG